MNRADKIYRSSIAIIKLGNIFCYILFLHLQRPHRLRKNGFCSVASIHSELNCLE